MGEPSVLVVEPDLLVRHPLAQFLRDCEYSVLEAATSAEARQLLDSPAHAVDIVLAAISLPDESGFVLSNWIRATHPTVKMILAGTVARFAEDAGELCEDGPGLSKPYNHQAVLDRISRLRAARDRNRAADP